MNNLIEKYKLLFKSPTAFFKTVVKEKDYGTIMQSLAYIILISVIVDIVFNIPVMIVQGKGSIEILASIPLALFSALFLFLIPYISAALNHIGVLIMGGRKGFFNTFKPSTYGIILYLIYGMLITIVSSLLFVMNPVDIEAVTAAEDFSLSDLPIHAIIVTSLIFIVAIVHVTVVEVIGVAKFQKLSNGRAFMAVFVIPLAIFLIIGIFIGLLFVIALGALIGNMGDITGNLVGGFV